MASINDYIKNIDQVLIDVVLDPVFSGFIDSADIETAVVSVGGVQQQVQALSRGSIAKLLKRVIAPLTQAGARVEFWLCDKSQFDLCNRLKTTPIGKLMEEFNSFFSNKWTEAGLTTAHVAVYIPALGLHPAAPFIAALAALGFVNRSFVELCHCP